MGRVLAWLPLVFLVAGCGATAHTAGNQPDARQRATPSAQEPHCRAGTVAVGNARFAVAAVAHGNVRAYRRPGVRPFATFGRLNVNRFPTVFRVLAKVRGRDCRVRWYRVQLPIKPNESTGFVRASAVAVGRVRSRLVVDVSAKRLTLLRSGRPTLRATVAVGSSATPTPIGRYYVNQRLIAPDPGGPFGPAAIGISAFSNVLTGWTQGGPVAIHGTNEPWSIGHAVSNGCIRVHNDVLRRLFKVTPAGTPVIIHP